jgi:hypothetical protein
MTIIGQKFEEHTYIKLRERKCKRFDDSIAHLAPFLPHAILKPTNCAGTLLNTHFLIDSFL